MKRKLFLSLFFFIQAFVINAVLIDSDDIKWFILGMLASFGVPFVCVVLLGLNKNSYQATIEMLSPGRPRDDSDDFDEIIGLKEKEKTFDEYLNEKKIKKNDSENK